ncbi:MULTISPECIES: response regulator transcription factor [unclassified Streptomyces]|uniref:response regulator transcription factor n=1 Tax=unclassified Streptomyces TaxID=2593676 RepID=UPI002E2D9E18|nr:response regulator transcription factor [Streptomyces sp. NBC_00228]
MSTYGGISETRSLARDGGQHLLVAVDEPDNAELLSTTLELAGYRIGIAGSGTEVLTRLAEQRFELVVIDAELPEMDALAQGRRLVTHRPPVLLLTAWDALDKLLPELGAGERDYVTKPFRIAEVLARIQVLLRGRAGGGRDGALHYADLVLDDTTCQARRGRRTLDLTPAEYRLLRHLLVNAYKVLSKEQISRYVWGDFRGDNAMEQLVSRLRRKVDQEGPALIHTRRGFGYWLGRAADEG